jgi:hypothetical protein
VACGQAHIELAEINEAIQKGRLIPDGNVLTPDGQCNVTKVHIVVVVVVIIIIIIIIVIVIIIIIIIIPDGNVLTPDGQCNVTKVLGPGAAYVTGMRSLFFLTRCCVHWRRGCRCM